jgi:hypothetical protein
MSRSASRLVSCSWEEQRQTKCMQLALAHHAQRGTVHYPHAVEVLVRLQHEWWKFELAAPCWAAESRGPATGAA